MASFSDASGTDDAESSMKVEFSVTVNHKAHRDD